MGIGVLSRRHIGRKAVEWRRKPFKGGLFSKLGRGNGMHLGQVPGFQQNVLVMPPAPSAWKLAPQYMPATAQIVPQEEGMLVGTFLSGLTVLMGGAVRFDRNST